ncbi:hypothetical protein [Winogradskyella ursingii]|uniref:hypothetical protein n=1 Tax=Winogradskyella ursingii TaxID=2686079 RepID=UPI0015C9E2FC|nr:hypothetical protein [Winogradskyella ursingii]
MKKLLFKSPEYYLIILLILAGYAPPYFINPIFIAIATIIILQLIFKNRISGILIGAIFFMVNLYFLGALLSEFNEFKEFSSEAKQLIFVGISIWIVNFIMSAIMIYKYLNLPFRKALHITIEKQNR